MKLNLQSAAFLQAANQPPFPVGMLLDDFNRANVGPPPSSQWTNNLFPGESGLKVFSNNLIGNIAGDNTFSNSYWNVRNYGPAVDAWFQVATTHITTPARRILIAVRITNIGAVNGYTGGVDIDTAVAIPHAWFIDRWTNGVRTNIANAPFSRTLNSLDWIGVRALRNKISVWHSAGGVRWKMVLSVNDDAHRTAGRVGLRVEDGTFRPDNWNGGSFLA